MTPPDIVIPDVPSVRAIVEARAGAIEAKAAAAELASNQAVQQARDATAAALAAAGTDPRTGYTIHKAGDHTTLPAVDGTYSIQGSADAGQVWTVTGGVRLRRPDLEVQTAAQVASSLDAIIAATLDGLKVAAGRTRGSTRTYQGRTYWWDDLRVNADDGVTILAPAGLAMGRWVLVDREWGLNLKWFEHLVVDGDWTPALRYALVLDDVYIPPGEFLFKPSATNTVTFPVGVRRTLSGSGPASTLKVADGTGAYGYFIGQADFGQYVTDITIRNLRIDQNCDNVTGAVLNSDAATAQNAIRFSKFAGVTIDRVHFNIATGINTVTLNGTDCTDATMTGCKVRWGRNQSQADYDNSAFYLNCTGQTITGNVFRARSIADRARGAIETHGSVSVVSGNTAVNFREGINIVSVSANVADPATSSLTVTGNVIDGACIGIRLWSITGKVLRNVKVVGNVITLTPAQWPELRDTGGIMMAYSSLGALDGDVDGLDIDGNVVSYPDTDTRTDYAYGSCAGIGLNGNGNYRNVRISHNRVKNAPMWAYYLGRVGKTLAGLQAFNNEAINPGTATGQAPTQCRVAVALSGLITGAVIGGFTVSETTPAAQATGYWFTSLTAGSSIEFQTPRSDAPNNPALAFPATLPTGITRRSLLDTSAVNAFTAKQTFTVSGARAVEAISDSVAVYGKSTGTQPAVVGDGGAGYGGQFFSKDAFALVAQQQGAALATVNQAVLYVERLTAAGTYNVTASTLKVNEASTVTTGTRFCNIFELCWDGVTKFLVSGASHAMGAGIITSGGWARASATLDFPSIAAGGTAELTISVPGALVGDGAVGGPPAGLEAGLMVGTPRVTAAGIVTIRVHNTTAAAIDPAAATYTVKVLK